MKSIYFLLIVLLISCGPAKIKDFDKDYTQDLVGKIKSVEIKNYQYRFLNKDTVMLFKTNIQNFDNDNNVINEKIITENDSDELIYEYQNKLLISKKDASTNNTYLTTYKYDKRNNLIEQKSFDDKKVFSKITLTYDKYDNPIETKIVALGKINVSSKIKYDYKKRFLIQKKSFDTIISSAIETKKELDKKGYIIKSPTINRTFFSNVIDKKGNLTKKTYHNHDGSIIETVTYKNTYDKKGNIIARERFLNGKLLEKTTYGIVYY